MKQLSPGLIPGTLNGCLDRLPLFFLLLMDLGFRVLGLPLLLLFFFFFKLGLSSEGSGFWGKRSGFASLNRLRANL